MRRAFAFRGFEPRDHAARVRRERAHLVDRSVEAATDGIAVARIDRWLVADRRIDLRGEFGQGTQAPCDFPNQWAALLAERRAQASQPPPRPGPAAAYRVDSPADCRDGQRAARDRRSASRPQTPARRDRPRRALRPRHAARESSRGRAADKRSNWPERAHPPASGSGRGLKAAIPRGCRHWKKSAPNDAA